MKDLMKPDYDLHLPHQTLGASNSRVSMNKNSRVISKVKPKIRIIHIFAPEIIKTDVKNFRSLVQSLTGKPAAGEAKTCKKRTKPKVSVIRNQDSNGTGFGDHQVNRLTGFSGLLANVGSHVKQEWESGECSNPNTYFDLEGLIQDFGDDFSSFPTMRSSQMDGFHVQQQQL